MAEVLLTDDPVRTMAEQGSWVDRSASRCKQIYKCNSPGSKGSSNTHRPSIRGMVSCHQARKPYIKFHDWLRSIVHKHKPDCRRRFLELSCFPARISLAWSEFARDASLPSDSQTCAFLYERVKIAKKKKSTPTLWKGFKNFQAQNNALVRIMGNAVANRTEKIFFFKKLNRLNWFLWVENNIFIVYF